jgi:hypothetical protein
MSPPSDRRSAVKLNGILFPSFSLLTVAYRPSLHTSRHYSSHTHTHTHTRWSNILSLPRRGIFTAHSLLFSAIFTAHIWQHWQFQIWRRREIKVSLLTVGSTNFFKYGAGGKFFPTHWWQHWLFQTWRPRGGSHVTGEVEGVILLLRKSLPPLGQSYLVTTVVNTFGWC